MGRADSDPYDAALKRGSPKVGEGLAKKGQGRGPQVRIQVNFPGVAAEWLVLA